MATMPRLACFCLLAWIVLSWASACDVDAAVRRRIVVTPRSRTVVSTRVMTVAPFGPVVSRTTWVGPRRTFTTTHVRPPAGAIIHRRTLW
jgi:hypothetical protein